MKNFEKKLLFFFAIQLILLYFWKNVITRKVIEESNLNQLSTSNINDLKKIFKKYGTSKHDHFYYNLYGFYFGHKKNSKLDVLEIGLGCGMDFGVGKSLLSWKEYFKNSQISIFEYDKKCADKFRDKADNLYIGDQSSFKELKQVEKSGPYDLIIDDGGHTRKQMIFSLVALFPILKKGGIYVVEDLYYANFSRSNDFNDYSKSMIDLVYDIIHTLVYKDHERVISFKTYGLELENGIKYLTENVLSVNCFRHCCAFIKKS